MTKYTINTRGTSDKFYDGEPLKEYGSNFVIDEDHYGLEY